MQGDILQENNSAAKPSSSPPICTLFLPPLRQLSYHSNDVVVSERKRGWTCQKLHLWLDGGRYLCSVKIHRQDPNVRETESDTRLVIQECHTIVEA